MEFVRIAIQGYGLMKLATRLSMVAILVNDQDEALRFYTEKLGLEKCLDVTYAPGMRLLTVVSRGHVRPQIALARPEVTLHGSERVRQVMQQVGRGVPWVFATGDCHRMYDTLRERGVAFLHEPVRLLYGVEAVFVDPFGNIFSLLEPAPEAQALCESRCIGLAA
ncbi:catechol 2,3-dioxygenase-like lactoylglutathione lyase family enzyme [Thermosporothrix hazakensis]|jgi:predicted enzyme related to lactoylglutathione lyase|uniref:Catechol 2,3-dioxygenase-like lactoylglutathione lyase family enzyme n=2 Tax=Thermosporothrix TaxID=768650 RepID=A0A326UCE1_THEHA|nr:VOC family protein [Thermosporothrix hazakensis]PZW33035.1 catechol 2,3-dioxygenase-like lactoylglutathione lyase family enzyme [Thermosporothrix hazakensis]BBH91016.1 extradiol dioxygenase [Thermosporothrix sp. COM3]GCE49067.1 extradiol dioxygenase [Thermosporothrix hazakensis]